MFRRMSLAEIVNRSSPLFAAFAENGERIVPSRIYVAPPDRHLIVSDGIVRLTRDPRETRSRPAIDPLFRSAARSYGRRVIAVLLSGLYDDGVQGLQIIHRNGGMVIVLKPDDTAFSQMPENAIKYDHPDYVLSASDYFPNSSNWSQIRKAAPQYAATTKQLSTMSRRRAMCVQTAGGASFEEANREFLTFAAG